LGKEKTQLKNKKQNDCRQDNEKKKSSQVGSSKPKGEKNTVKKPKKRPSNDKNCGRTRAKKDHNISLANQRMAHN